MEMSWLSAILVGAGYLALGFFIGSHYPPRFPLSRKFSFSKDKEDDSLLNNNKQNKNTKSKIKDPLEIEQLADILDDFKMVNS
jgi:PTH2 family peptidyl-tRNA hydrolase